MDRLRTRCRCAWTWITEFSPEDFRFSVADASSEVVALAEEEKKAVKALVPFVESWDGADEKDLAQRIYDAAAQAGVENTVLFTAVYKALIGKEKGPKLALFIKTIGKERSLSVLRKY